MSAITRFIDIVLHLDKYLGTLLAQYGSLTYLILFLIIFIETGLVLTPFLPGDSLLFAAGAFAGQGLLNVFVLIVMLTTAAVLGDTVNYWLGYHFGEKVFQKSRFYHPEYLERTNHFFEKYGKKTIFLARFVPVVRTFAPFAAGIGKMSYPVFLAYNVVGGLAWVLVFVLGGFFLGNLTVVKDNFSLMIVIIIIISFVPIVREWMKQRREERKS